MQQSTNIRSNYNAKAFSLLLNSIDTSTSKGEFALFKIEHFNEPARFIMCCMVIEKKLEMYRENLASQN